MTPAPLLQAPEMLLVVHDAWRRIGIAVRGDRGPLWWFVDEIADPLLDPSEIAAIDDRVESEIARRQQRWREQVEANRIRHQAETGRPLARSFQ